MTSQLVERLRVRLGSGRSNLGPVKSDSVANGSPLLRHFLERSSVAQTQRPGNGPPKLVTCFSVIERV